MVVWFHDVSNHQSVTPPLWDGLIVKASEGSGFRDPRFWQHINAARDAGKIHAGYHFLRSDSPVKDQVATFTSVCPKEIAAVPDVEWIKQDNVIVSAPSLAQTREFVSRLLDLGYHVPMQYLPRWYWNYWGQPDLSGLPPLWNSYYPDYTIRPREVAWSLIPQSAKSGFGGLPLVALQFTSSPLDQNRAEYTPDEFYSFMSTTQRGDILGDWNTPITLTADERRANGDPDWTGEDATFTPDIWTKYSSFYAGQAMERGDVIIGMLKESAAREAATLALAQALAKDKAVTVDTLRGLINDAVKENVKITGTISITGAGVPTLPALSIPTQPTATETEK